METTDQSFASSRKCEAEDSLLMFVFTAIRKYIEENPQRSAFKIQNVLCEQAFNCFAWVTSFFFCKHREEQRDTLLDLREAQVEAGSKDALKEMDTSCININITARTLFLFSNMLFYCVQLERCHIHWTPLAFFFFTIARSNRQFTFPYRRHRHALRRLIYDSLFLNTPH